MYNRVTKNEKVHVKDSLGNITNQLKDTIVYKYEYQQVANPRIKDLERLDEKLQNLSIQIQNYESEQGGKRQKLEKEILLKSGFLHELKIMFH